MGHGTRNEAVRGACRGPGRSSSARRVASWSGQLYADALRTQNCDLDSGVKIGIAHLTMESSYQDGPVKSEESQQAATATGASKLVAIEAETFGMCGIDGECE